MTHIIAIRRAQRVAITDLGHECALVNIFDDEGDESDDATTAVAAVCQLPDGRWIAIDLTQFEPVVVH